MAPALVELIEGMTFTLGDRTFRKNAPQTLTDPDEILVYRNKSNFRVSDIAIPKTKAAAVAKDVPRQNILEPAPAPEPAAKPKPQPKKVPPKKAPPKKPMKRKKG